MWPSKIRLFTVLMISVVRELHDSRWKFSLNIFSKFLHRNIHVPWVSFCQICSILNMYMYILYRQQSVKLKTKIPAKTGAFMPSLWWLLKRCSRLNVYKTQVKYDILIHIKHMAYILNPITLRYFWSPPFFCCHQNSILSSMK